MKAMKNELDDEELDDEDELELLDDEDEHDEEHELLLQDDELEEELDTAIA